MMDSIGMCLANTNLYILIFKCSSVNILEFVMKHKLYLYKLFLRKSA